MSSDHSTFGSHEFNGRSIIMENLRQHCIHKLLKNRKKAEKFFEYIAFIHKKCETRIDQKCSLEGIESIGMKYLDVEQCVEKTFVQSNEGGDKYEGENLVLEQMIKEWQLLGTHLQPGIVINETPFRGQLNPYNVFEDICEAFTNMPN